MVNTLPRNGERSGRKEALSPLHAFIAAIGAGDRRAAAACFTREGCLVTPDGTAVHGRPEIAAILAQMIARNTEIEVEQLAIRPAGDVALAGGRLAMSSDGPEGRRVVQACRSSLVLREVEGAWKIAILAPWANDARD